MDAALTTFEAVLFELLNSADYLKWKQGDGSSASLTGQCRRTVPTPRMKQKNRPLASFSITFPLLPTRAAL